MTLRANMHACMGAPIGVGILLALIAFASPLIAVSSLSGKTHLLEAPPIEGCRDRAVVCRYADYERSAASESTITVPMIV